MSYKTLEERVTVRIKRSQREVFLRKDFENLGGYDQIGRALKRLTDSKVLIKLGYGLYAKAKPSMIDGTPVPRVGIRALAGEALGRFGIEIALSDSERAYNSGKSTQVPTGRTIGIKGPRIQRKIGYNGVTFNLERVKQQ